MPKFGTFSRMPCVGVVVVFAALRDTTLLSTMSDPKPTENPPAEGEKLSKKYVVVMFDPVWVLIPFSASKRDARSKQRRTQRKRRRRRRLRAPPRSPQHPITTTLRLMRRP